MHPNFGRSVADRFKDKIQELKAEHRKAIGMELWDQIPLLKGQLSQMQDKIAKAMDMLATIKMQIKDFEKKENIIQKKERELEALEKEFEEDIDRRMREVDNRWKEREADVARISKAGDQIVKINLMDEKMLSFSKSKLMAFPNTKLANTFSGAHDVNRVEGRVFLDNDPEAFKLLLKYLNYGD